MAAYPKSLPGLLRRMTIHWNVADELTGVTSCENQTEPQPLLQQMQDGLEEDEMVFVRIRYRRVEKEGEGFVKWEFFLERDGGCGFLLGGR